MALLSNIEARETSTTNRDVAADLGTWQGWAGSVRQGYKESVTSVGINWLARIWAGHLDRENGLEDMDEESFVKQYGDPSATGFEFRKDESPSQAEMRYQDFIDQQVQARRSEDIGGLGRFAGGMVGNMLSPADIVLSAVPYAGMAKLAKATKATSVAVRTRQSMSQAYEVVDRMSALKVNTLTQALMRGEDVGYIRVFGELGRRSFIEQGAEAAFVMYGSNQIGRDYGALDAGADLLFGGTLISAINIPGAWRIKKVADSVKLDIVNRNTMAQMAEDGNIRGIMDILRSYDDEATGGFGQAVDANPRIRAILEMSPEEYINDRLAVEELKQFIYGNKDAVWLANLKGLVPLDPSKPIIEARRAQFEQMDRIIESVVKGNPDVKLTSEDFQLLAELGQKNRDLMTLLSGKEVKGFEDPFSAARAREQGTMDRREKIERAYRIVEGLEDETPDFTHDQAYDFLKAETERHWAEIEKAQELVSSIFGIDLKKELSLSKEEGLGRYEGRTRTLLYGDLSTYVELGGFGKVTPSSLVFHETVHALFDLRPPLWKSVQKIIYSEPALKQKIDRVAETRGYSDAQLAYKERPSILMEMMITERDFWEALNRQNKTLFDQFKELIARIYNEVVNFNTPNLERIKPEDLTSGNIAEFAERIVEVIQKDRAQHKESLGRSDTVYFEPPDPTKIEPAARKAEEAIEGQTAQAEERNRVKETEAAKEVEKSAPKAALPVLQVFKTRIGQLLQGDLGTLALDLKSDYKDIRIKVDKSIAPLGNGAVAEDMRTIGNVIVKAKKRTQSRYNHAKDVLESRKTVTKKVLDIDVETLGEAMAYRIHGLREKVTNGELTPTEALQQATEALQTEELQTILTAVDNYHKQQRVIRGAMGTKNHKQRLKYVKSFLDGLQRRGVKLLGGSLSSEISSQMTKDMAALRKAFVDNGFVDYLDSTVHRVEGESEMKANERAQARLDASNALMWDLMQYYKTGEVPERFTKESEPFRALGDSMKHTLHSQIGQLNELGAAINLRQDHMGIAYRWDNNVIRRIGREKFKERMREVLDKDKIREAHGGVMVGRTNQDGFAETMVPFDFEDFLDAWYIEATSPVKPMDHSSMDIAKSFSKSRMIHVKEGKEMDTLLEFSGHNSLGRLLQDQIRHRSELIAIGNKLGNNPLPNIDGIMEGIGIQAGINTTRTPTSGKLDKWLAKTGFEEKIHDWDIRHTVDTAKFLTGALDNPESHDWSFWGKTYRQISNLAFLWTSTISAINDIPLALATLDQVGATNGLEDLSTLLKTMKRAASRRFHGNDASLTQFYEGSGANMDAIKNAGARRMALAEANGDTVIGRASEFMFTVNGLNFWTGMMQEAFADIMTQSLGRMAKSGNWDPHMKYTMETMGFTAEDFKMMEGKQVDINGVDRLGPPSFVGTDLEMKLLNFFATYRDQAVIVPDASTQALVRFGTQAGTFHGEAIRSFFQYASFPTAMNRITMRKLMIDHGGNRPWTQGQLTLGRMMTYIGTMMMFGYLSMVMKDLARARGPVMPWEMGAGNWTRLLDQTGMLGVVGNIVQGGAEMRPSAVISPNFSTQWKMGYKLMTEGFGEALYAGRAYTGDNIPLVGSAITSSLAYIFQGGYAEALRIGSHFREERGTEQLFPVPKP